MTWDTTLSVEGVATAAGVLGAAIGYIVNIILSWRAERRDTRRRGTYTVILQLLEESLILGLTEEQLWEQYSGDVGKDLRNRYSALPPEKLGRVLFEAMIRDLVLDRLVEIVGKDRYRLEVRRLSQHDYEEASAEQIAEIRIDRSQLKENILRHAETAGEYSWDRKRWLELLPRLDPDEGIRVLQTMADSGDNASALAAVEVLTSLIEKQRHEKEKARKAIAGESAA